MNIEKLKAAAIAANQAWMDEPYEIEPALVLELIERLEAAENQRDELLEAAEVIEINAEECLDFDECTAMLVPIDDYHKLMHAIANVKENGK